MEDDIYEEVDATRALQESATVRQQNYETMCGIGAYNLLKVHNKGELRTSVSGYITLLPAISGLTPIHMRDALGLRLSDLTDGADIYRLSELPDKENFLPRGYTTLVSGLRLKKGIKQDKAGYRPGHGAWQVTLIRPVPAVRIAILAANEPFEPGMHPKYRV
ncbi:MAG: hypothetical protein AAGE86_07665 [Pseudomonadota bacterium]